MILSHIYMLTTSRNDTKRWYYNKDMLGIVDMLITDKHNTWKFWKDMILSPRHGTIAKTWWYQYDIIKHTHMIVSQKHDDIIQTRTTIMSVQQGFYHAFVILSFMCDSTVYVW